MFKLLFAALALVAPLCLHADTINGVQREKTAAQLKGLAGLRTATPLSVDRRIAVPDRAQPKTASAGQGSIEFGYDADGNLIREVINPGTPDEQRITYTVDKISDPPVIFAESVNGRLTRSYHWEFGNELQGFTDHLPDGTSVTRIAQLDGQGSIRALTDRNGTVTDTFEYNAAGEVVSRTGSTDLRFLFRGEHMNRKTGWYHLRARWMDPKAGRFVSQDPFPGFRRDPQSQHKYTYAHNDPVNRSDPSGLMTITELSIAAAQYTALSVSTVVAFGTWVDRREHDYFVSSKICGSSSRCTIEQVFEALRRFPAPGATGDYAVKTGDISFAVPVGRVDHVVDMQNHTVRNVTRPFEHWLYYGDVLRKVEFSNGSMCVVTEGKGEGPFASLNERLADSVWGGVDQNIANEFR